VRIVLLSKTLGSSPCLAGNKTKTVFIKSEDASEGVASKNPGGVIPGLHTSGLDVLQRTKVKVRRRGGGFSCGLFSVT